jgi:protein-disulfide isomerase
MAMETNPRPTPTPDQKPTPASVFKFIQDNFLGVSILLAAVLIAGAIVSSNPAVLERFRTSKSPSEKTLLPGAGPGVGGLPILGNPDAKVAIVEFGDYQCSFCARFYHTTEKQILAEYVSTGKAKFAWRDFAFLGEESFWAAEAARCANDQGKFWEYHNILFERHAGANEGAFAKENLKRFASELGLNRSQFDACLDSGKHRAAVEADTRGGVEAGVSATPTTFVNASKVLGALSFETFKAAIEQELESR